MIYLHRLFFTAILLTTTSWTTAQISLNTFTPNTPILSAEVNGNFSTLANEILARQGFVTGTCAPGYAIRAINADGTVVCNTTRLYVDRPGGSSFVSQPAIRVDSSNDVVTTSREVFRVDDNGGLLARGELGIGNIPATGGGERLMWYPFRVAFRAGGLADDVTAWDDAQIGFYSWAGGKDTRATGFGTFAFGDGVVVTGTLGAALGADSTVSGTVGFSAGASNNCSGFACITMGYTNTASGQGSVAIGYRTTASANYSTALGHRASTDGRTGAFVYGDASTTETLRATANNQFRVRAAGGIQLRTNSSLTNGCNLAAGSGTWSCTSDRNLKENFADVDGEGVLAQIAAMPIQSWNYIGEGERVRHLGPVAQDFYAAFGLGNNDTEIGLLDISGVSMLAIQALERRTAELEAMQAELADVRAELAAMKTERAATEARFAQIETLLHGLAGRRLAKGD